MSSRLLAAAFLSLLLLALAPRLALATQPPGPKPEVSALLQEGEKAEEAYAWVKALQIYEKALAKARDLDDKDGEANTLHNIGGVYANTGQPQKALEYYQQALPLRRAVGDKAGEANTLNMLGWISASTGEPQKALEYYQRALPLARAVGNKGGEASTLANIGSLYSVGEAQKALEYCQQALRLFKEVGDKTNEARTLANIGWVYSNTGQPQKALEYYQQALPLARAVGNKGGEAVTLGNIGWVYANTDQTQKALEYLRRALPMLRAVGDKAGEATTLGRIGGLYVRTGQPLKALEYHRQALLLCKEMDDKAGEAATFTDIGVVYAMTGQPQKALEYYQRALPMLRAVGNKAGEAYTLNSIGIVYGKTGQPLKALEHYQRALLLFKEVGDKAEEADTLTNMGVACSDIGWTQKALEYYQQALPLHRAVGDKADEAITLDDLGTVYQDTGKPQKALEYYQRALLLFKEMGERAGEGLTLTNIGLVYSKSSQPQKALPYYHDAVLLVEETRDSLGTLTQTKVSLQEQNSSSYHLYVDLLAREKQPEEAFAWAQKTKGRALLDLMLAGKVDTSRSLSEKERQEERDLKRRLSGIQRQLVQAASRKDVDASRIAAIQQQMAAAERALETFTDGLYVSHPELRDQQAATTLSLPEVARRLPADTALLEYVTLKARDLDRTLLFCLTLESGRPQLHIYRVEKKAAELGQEVEAFRAACAGSAGAYRERARELYRLLVAPAAKQLAGKRRLLVCPDGPLWGLPFQALVAAGGKEPRAKGKGQTGQEQFLLERFEIDYAYSVSAWDSARRLRERPGRRKPAGSLLAVADPAFGGATAPPEGTPAVPGLGPVAAAVGGAPPDPEAATRDLLGLRGGIGRLAGTRREAEAIKAAFPDAVVYTDQAAQKEAVRQAAGQYRYLHFATHGQFNDSSPMMSFLLLAPPAPGVDEDAYLTAHNITELDLCAELVVLSACETARGTQHAGEGVVGLTWALFVAGSPTQVLSQWKVEDTTTAALMGQFYRGLAKKQAKGGALRAAALSVLRDGKHSHPFYWAPFVLVGDWR